jgi:hypothetical protein
MSVPVDRFRRLSEAVADQAVYEQRRGDGSLLRLAVGLNGYPIYLRTADGAEIRELTEIIIGAPPDDVFSPPPGVHVKDVPLEDVFSKETIKKLQTERPHKH